MFLALTASLMRSTSCWYRLRSRMAFSLASFSALSRALTLSAVALSRFSSLGSSQRRSALSRTNCKKRSFRNILWETMGKVLLPGETENTTNSSSHLVYYEWKKQVSSRNDCEKLMSKRDLFLIMQFICLAEVWYSLKFSRKIKEQMSFIPFNKTSQIWSRRVRAPGQTPLPRYPLS